MPLEPGKGIRKQVTLRSWRAVKPKREKVTLQVERQDKGEILNPRKRRKTGREKSGGENMDLKNSYRDRGSSWVEERGRLPTGLLRHRGGRGVWRPKKKKSPNHIQRSRRNQDSRTGGKSTFLKHKKAILVGGRFAIWE